MPVARVSDPQTNVPHKAKRDDRGKKAQDRRRENIRRSLSEAKGERTVEQKKASNPRAYSMKSVNRARVIIQKRADTAQKAAKLPQVRRVGSEPPPDLIAVVGPSGVGKSTLIKSLIKNIAKRTLTSTVGPITTVAGKGKRITLMEIPCTLPAILDIAKIVDLVILVIDGHAGFEMDHFEALNIFQATGFPKVFTVCTHMDKFTKVHALQKQKVKLRDRVWKEVQPGSRVYFMPGILNGGYPRTEIANLARAISQQDYKVVLRWREAHAGILVDRVEDVTDPGLFQGDEEHDKLIPHTVAFFGYLRGSYLDKTQELHIPGYGDVRMADLRRVDDPCPLVKLNASTGTEKRTLSARDRTLYCPFSNVGDIVYDDDGVYVRAGGDDLGLRKQGKSAKEQSARSAKAASNDVPEGVRILSELRNVGKEHALPALRDKEIEEIGEDAPAEGIQLFDDDEPEVLITGIPGYSPGPGNSGLDRGKSQGEGENRDAALSESDDGSDAGADEFLYEKDGNPDASSPTSSSEPSEERDSSETSTSGEESSTGEGVIRYADSKHVGLEDIDVERMRRGFAGAAESSTSGTEEDSASPRSTGQTPESSANVVSDLQASDSVEMSESSPVSPNSSEGGESAARSPSSTQPSSSSSESELTAGEQSTTERQAASRKASLFSSCRLILDPAAKHAIEDVIYDYHRRLDVSQLAGLGSARSLAAAAAEKKGALKSRLLQLFDDDQDDFRRQVDVFSLFPADNNAFTCGKVLDPEGTERDVSNIVPSCLRPVEGGWDYPYDPNDSSSLFGREYAYARSCFVTGDWDLAEVADEVLHGRTVSSNVDRPSAGAAEALGAGSAPAGTQVTAEGRADDQADDQTDGRDLILDEASPGGARAARAARELDSRGRKPTGRTEQAGPDGQPQGGVVETLLGDLALDSAHMAKAKKAVAETEERNTLLDQGFLDDSRHPPGAYLRVLIYGIDHSFIKSFLGGQSRAARSAILSSPEGRGLTGYEDPRAAPLILGGLLHGESNYGYVTAKVKKHRWHRKILKSRNPLLVSVGWRRFQTLPVYSLEQQGSLAGIDVSEQTETARHRLLKYTPEHMHCEATFWGPSVPANTGIIAFDSFLASRDEPEVLERRLALAGAGREIDDSGPRLPYPFRVALTGSVLDTSATHSVYKKLKLVGTVMKVVGTACFVQNMFSSRMEATAFLGAGLKAVSGLRGVIKKAERAPEGVVRCTFEDKLRVGDVVFLKTFVPVAVSQFYDEFREHRYLAFAEFVGVKTFAQLRAERALPIPVDPESVYTMKEARKVSAAPPEDDELKQELPSRLLSRLPFKSQVELLEAKKPLQIKDAYLRQLAQPDNVTARTLELQTQISQLHKERKRVLAEREERRRAQAEKEQARREAEIREATKENRRKKAAKIQVAERAALKRQKL